jgi:hypothetical protein
MGDNDELEPRIQAQLVVVPRFRQTLLYIVAAGLLVALVVGDLLLVQLGHEIQVNRRVYCSSDAARSNPACRGR